MRRLLLPVAVTLSLVAVPAGGQGGFSSRDRALGAKENTQILSALGGPYRGPQARYVESVGRRIAAQSGVAARPQDYTVTLLNSSVSNALALPGGYVYVTRQLLALMNNEAELAFVMGHEVGHVAARHAQKRQTGQTIAGIGQVLVGVLTGSGTLANLAGQGAQVAVLGYSREQERDADELGIRYLARAGYDPMAAPEILDQLGQQDRLAAQLRGQGRDAETPGWLRTHPATDERVRLARRYAAKVARTAGPEGLGRDRFLDAIDGMLYDDDPGQGFIDGSSFRHPTLGVGFDLPAGFVLANSDEAVTATGPGGARALFSSGRLGQGQSLADYSRLVLGQLGIRGGGTTEGATINGLPAAITRLRADSRSGPVEVGLAVYRWSPGVAYTLLMLAPAGRDSGFDRAASSLRRIAPGETSRLQARRIRVVRVQAGDTIATMARRMAYRDNAAARFMVLNGIDQPRPLKAGERVKLVVYGGA